MGNKYIAVKWEGSKVDYILRISLILVKHL